MIFMVTLGLRLCDPRMQLLLIGWELGLLLTFNLSRDDPLGNWGYNICVTDFLFPLL